MFSPRANVEVRSGAELVSRVDRELRAREIAMYREHPAQRMPVMVPVSRLGGRVQWPVKFQ